MSVITLFQEKIKPFKLRGTGIIHTVENSKVDENLYALKQDDVNLWIYQKNNTVIAIDAGYKDHKTLYSSLKEFNISNESIKALFLTHADIDHVGGLISKKRYAPNAKILLHKDEEYMILGKEKRFCVAGFKLKNPVFYQGKYTLLKDQEIITIDDIEVQCFHQPGHTRGHSVFLVDHRYLFTGDSIAANETGGYCFFDFYNMDTTQNIESLKRLKELLKNNHSIKVCTAHNGIHSVEKAFLHIDQVAKGTKRKAFDQAAPYDPFK